VSDEPLWRRYRQLLRPDPRRDVDDEIAFHLSMRMDEYERSGLSTPEAREEAMRLAPVFALLEKAGVWTPPAAREHSW